MGMNLDWLYGPRDNLNSLRSMTLDVEVLRDLSFVVEPLMKQATMNWPMRTTVSGQPGQYIDRHEAEFLFRGQKVSKDQLGDLSVPDRNELTLRARQTRLFKDDEADYETYVELVVISPQAQVIVNAGGHDQTGSVYEAAVRVRKYVVEYLYAHGRQQPLPFPLKPFWQLSFVLLALFGWVWASVQQAVPIGLHLVIVGVVGWIAFFVVRDIRRDPRASRKTVRRRFTYRAMSRREAAAERANGKRDARIAVISVVATAILAYAVWWVTDGRQASAPPEPAPSVSSDAGTRSA